MSRVDVPISGRSLQDTRAIKTGWWRTVEPFYEDRTAPCAGTCLAGEDIPLQIELVHEERYAEAVDVLRSANPFPAISGRVCPAPCETRCLRETLGGAVSIREIERFLGDYAIREGLCCEPVGAQAQRVAVVGAGPAGLAAAHYLGLRGYRVTVFDGRGRPGGLLRYGIPPFRLPRDVLDAELDLAFRRLPVDFRMRRRIDEKDRPMLAEYDAVVLAAGRGDDSPPRIPGATAEMSGLRLLERADRAPMAGTAIVIGGGSSAFDCARTALRLGARPAIYYRRSRREMPAFEHDIVEALQEGIEIVENVAPVRIEKDRITFVRTHGAGRDTPVVLVEGTEFTVAADHILIAAGERPERLFPALQPDGGVAVDATFAATEWKFHAAGDFTTEAPGTVTGAIRQGRLAAVAVHNALSGAGETAHRVLSHERDASGEVVGLDGLNLNYVRVKRRSAAAMLGAADRVRGFDEVNRGLREPEVRREAERCLSCGTCVFCFNCMNFCPDRAISFDADAQAFRVDFNYCKGCLVCVTECPRGCMGYRNATTGTADGK